MSIIRNQDDLKKLRHSARILASMMHHLKPRIKPGVRASDLDKFAEEFIRDQGGLPSFKGLYDFPDTLITEINDEVVHGTSPEDKIIPENCIASFDCGVSYQGLYSDMCILLTLGEVSSEVKLLEEKTRESLWAGINQVKAGKKLGDVGYAIQTVLDQAGLGNVTDLGGHGLGYKPHDEPHITHAGKPGKGARLFENQVIAIEPMVTLGSGEVVFVEVPGSGVELVKTPNGEWAAHIEHSLLVTKNGCEVLTQIEESEVLS